MTRKYIVTVKTQDTILEFPVTARSSQQAYDTVEKEWNDKYGTGDFAKQTVGVNRV
jgi:hypothetical protein